MSSTTSTTTARSIYTATATSTTTPLLQSDQNGPLTTANNPNTATGTSDEETKKKLEMGANNLGSINTEVKNRMNDKISPCANDVTGKWIANDGGVYYIKRWR